jgi:hypothetical protein
MKTAIVYIADGSYGLTGQVKGVYEGAPNQGAYASEHGNPLFTQHIEVPAEFDVRALVAEVVEGVATLSEDEEVKAALAMSDAVQASENAVAAGMMFGAQLIREFAGENVRLGITADEMTGTVLDNMAPVMIALQSGSLFEAIARAKAIPEESKDEKYITDARLLAFVNKIETRLGIPLSESL